MQILLYELNKKERNSFLNKKENTASVTLCLLRLCLWLCVVAAHKWFDPEGYANDVGRQRKRGAR